MAWVGATGLQLVAAEPTGIAGWTLAARRAGSMFIDGLDTRIVDVQGVARSGTVHELGASVIDHVVVMTPSLERTCGAISEVTGAPLKRVREIGGGIRQGFHRLGEVIVEVVERPDISPDAPARFWGLVFTVSDLPAVADRLGPDLLGPVKPAVQRGRSIATVRESAGLGLPVALMSP